MPDHLLDPIDALIDLIEWFRVSDVPEPQEVTHARACLAALKKWPPKNYPERGPMKMRLAAVANGPGEPFSLSSNLTHAHRHREWWEQKIAELYRQSLKAPEAEKAVPDWQAEMLGESCPTIQYPVPLCGITFAPGAGGDVVRYGRKAHGKFVAVRPVGKEQEGETFLGIYIGDIAMAPTVRLIVKDGVLEVGVGLHNPAIWVPDLSRIVFGAESWWGVLKSPDDLKQITDADINGIWYVQAMKALTAPPPAPETPA